MSEIPSPAQRLGLLKTAWRPVLFFLLILLSAKSWNWDSPYLITMPLLAFLVPALVLWKSPTWVKLLGHLETFWQRLDRHFLPIACALALAASLAACFFILQPIPHVPDEFSYLFQAKVFAAGKLYAQDPGLPAFQLHWTIKHDGRLFSVFTPGWPALLSLGVWLRSPALVNPLLGVLCLIVIFYLIGEMAGRQYAKLSVLFCLLSPFHLFTSASLMSHTSLLLFSALSVLLMVRGMRSGNGRAMLLAGFAAGFSILIRPPDGGVLWLATCAYFLLRERRRAVRLILTTCIGVGAGILVYFLYNRILVGQWFLSPYRLQTDAIQYGFGPRTGIPEWEDNFDTPGHTPWRSLINLNFNLAVLSSDLFGWPVSSLSFALLFLVFGRKQWYHHLAMFLAGGLVLVYAGFWYHGVCFGARYYYTLLPYLALFTISGILELPTIVKEHFGLVIGGLEKIAFTLVVLFFLFGACIYLPLVSLVAPYHNFCGSHDEAHDFVRRARITNAIVFIRPGGEQAMIGVVANEVDIGQSSVVFASDLGADENQKVIDRFPGRSVYYFKQKERESRHREKLAGLYLRSLSECGPYPAKRRQPAP